MYMPFVNAVLLATGIVSQYSPGDLVCVAGQRSRTAYSESECKQLGTGRSATGNQGLLRMLEAHNLSSPFISVASTVFIALHCLRLACSVFVLNISFRSLLSS